jgi:hypothetical protein
LTVSFPEHEVVADGPDFSRTFVMRPPVTSVTAPGFEFLPAREPHHANIRIDATPPAELDDRSGAWLCRVASVIRRPPDGHFSADAWPGRAAPAEGAGPETLARDRSRRRNALRPEWKTAGCPACRVYFTDDPPERTWRCSGWGQNIEIYPATSATSAPIPVPPVDVGRRLFSYTRTIAHVK